MKPCRHEPEAPGCRVCWLAANVRAYQRLWGLPETGEFESVPRFGGVRPAPAASPPCAHLGAAIAGAEREARGLDHRKLWRLCLYQAKPLGEAVCGCKGCGPRCPGYTAATPAGDPA